MKTADGTGAEQSLWLRGEDVPEGEWTLLDAAGNVSVANTIQREQVGQCLLDWSPVQKRVNLELYSPERQLAPGESIVVEQSYEVRSPAVRAEQGAAQ